MRMPDWSAIKVVTDFGFFMNFYGALNALEKLAATEDWSYSKTDPDRRNKNNPILENYIHHTFKRLRDEYLAANDIDKNKIIYIDEKIACFNTGLYTKNYNRIYAVFQPALKESDRKPFTFLGFEQQASGKLASIKELPRRANYFSSITELIYDSSYELRANIEHILDENISRFPPELQNNPMLNTLFSGAVILAQKRVEANYRAAVPTYYNGEICLMLPLCLRDPNTTDLALAVKRNDGFYTAKTVLTLDMAYNDARLIAKPDADWLTP